MDAPATYVHWWFVLVSIPNLLLVLGMIVVFVAALLAPFPFHRDADAEGHPHE